MTKSTNSNFNLVQAAEALLEDAKRLTATASYEDDEVELRRHIAQTAKKIAFETAPPIDVVKSDWVVLANVAVCNLFIEWKAFDHIPLNGYISVRDLARALNAQESLIARLTNLLLSTCTLLPGPSPSTLTHSRLSPLYSTPSPVSALALVAVGNGMLPYSHWPSYFRAHGRTEPYPAPPSPAGTPFTFSWGHPELQPWEVKALYPDYAVAFTRSMKAREIVGGDVAMVGEGAVYDLGWVGEEAEEKGKGEVVVVDVGGGLGQLLRDVLRDVRGLRAGQCVLQDREEVVEVARKRVRDGDGGLEGVVMMAHDFNKPQPVKGALVYLLRRVLLDYSDALAVGILRHLADALPADNPKARVIVIEERLLDTPMPQNCIVDLVMMNLGGKLRNKAMFGELGTAAGLKMVGYYAREGDSICVVEFVKA